MMSVFRVPCSVFRRHGERVVSALGRRAGIVSDGWVRATIAFAFGLLLLLVLPSVSLAQAERIVDEVKERRRKEILEGTEAFRRLLFDQQLEPVGDFASLLEHPTDKILIVLGNLDVLPQGVVDFVNDGGAVLLASDRPLRTREAKRQLLFLAGVSIAPSTYYCAEEDWCYKRKPFCPFVMPIRQSQPDLFTDPLTGLSRHVATNVPSLLVVERRARQFRPIATLPDQCHNDAGDVPFQVPPGDLLPLFAVAGELGKGRVLVMADHSVFINEMMLPTDNGNFDFTSGAITWLRGDNQRTKVLFIDERGIQTKFEIPLKSLNIPPEEALRMLFANRNEILVAAENVLGRLENDGAFDRGFMNLFDRAGFPASRLVRYALVALTVVLGLYVIYRVGFRHRFRHDLTAPMLTTMIDRNLPVAALAEQRHLTLLASGNLEEPARHLARQWFACYGVEAFEGAMPALDTKGSWWTRRRLSARLREAWRLAAGLAGRVTPHRLAALERDLSDLRAAHGRGEWHLSVAVVEAG